MPRIDLSDEKKTMRVSLTVDPEGKEPPLTLFDENGKLIFKAPK